MSTIRAFLALPLPLPVCDALERLQDSLPAARPVPLENFHLTLAFLGEQPEDRLEALHWRLDAMHAPAPAVAIGAPATFGRRSPRVVFTEIAPDAALSHLHRKVRAAARAEGMALARERFRPHVTLGRIGGSLPPEELERLRQWLERKAGFGLPVFHPDHVVLYRSTLTGGGAVHEPLAEYPLAPPDPA